VEVLEHIFAVFRRFLDLLSVKPVYFTSVKIECLNRTLEALKKHFPAANPHRGARG